MSWTRSLITALAVCVVLLAGSAGCGSRGAQGRDTEPSPPAGTLLDERDEQGRPYREVDGEGAPEVGVEVTPDAGGGWDVRLTVRNFLFSPGGTGGRATAGRGLARLYVDGRPVAALRTPVHHLSARLVPRGTHQVTARLYADDGSVWAVDGEPVESTADITVSEQDPGAGPEAGTGAGPDADRGTGARADRGAGPDADRGAPRSAGPTVTAPASAPAPVPASAPASPAATVLVPASVPVSVPASPAVPASVPASASGGPVSGADGPSRAGGRGSPEDAEEAS
ncbi:hypothetical protein [Streptomyces sp. enrichment culture]|uniref:hypothetical protein n=1 Tax=Streptomyces sp. enrichment culture TaxID=1795815 RepID=UPI003F559F81